MTFPKPKLMVRPSDPLLLTRELDIFFILSWAIFAGWGYFAVFQGLETITLALGSFFNFIWALGIAVLSSIALIASIMVFFKTKMRQVSKKRIELVAVWGLIFLVAVYPVYLAGRAISQEEINIWNSVIISLLYVLIPFFRIRNLRYRIRYYAKTTRV